MFRFRSEEMRTFFLRLECMLGCAETPFLVKINTLKSFVHQIKLIIVLFVVRAVSMVKESFQHPAFTAVSYE